MVGTNTRSSSFLLSSAFGLSAFFCTSSQIALEHRGEAVFNTLLAPEESEALRI